MRVCLAYDCLYPWTVGGAERWLRSLAENLAANGDEVTYLTRKQWGTNDKPCIPGVRVVAVSPPSELYGESGTRRTGEALRFGWGVFRFLLRNRGEFDVIHVTAAPFFGVFGAKLAMAGTRIPVFVDWDETWTKDYWLNYAGPVKGRIGWLMQSLCVRTSNRAFIKSRLHRDRLIAQGIPHEPVVLPGLIDLGSVTARKSEAKSPPTVLFAGRHIPEKRVTSLPSAISRARRSVPDLEGLILGDGPELGNVRREIARLGAEDFIKAPGFTDSESVQEELGTAACLVLPSSREGYGIVVVEAASKGTPSIIVGGPDNAAVELVETGINGFVARDDSAESLAATIVEAVKQGDELRDTTFDWFADKSSSISTKASSAVVKTAYQEELSRKSR